MPAHISGVPASANADNGNATKTKMISALRQFRDFFLPTGDGICAKNSGDEQFLVSVSHIDSSVVGPIIKSSLFQMVRKMRLILTIPRANIFGVSPPIPLNSSQTWCRSSCKSFEKHGYLKPFSSVYVRDCGRIIVKVDCSTKNELCRHCEDLRIGRPDEFATRKIIQLPVSCEFHRWKLSVYETRHSSFSGAGTTRNNQHSFDASVQLRMPLLLRRIPRVQLRENYPAQITANFGSPR